jgi:hypothetical protein
VAQPGSNSERGADVHGYHRAVNDVERDRFVAWLVAEFEVQNGIDVAHDENAIVRLREAAATAVAQMRAEGTTDVSLPFLAADETGPKHLHVVLTKQRIDAILDGREGPPHVERAPPPKVAHHEKEKEEEEEEKSVSPFLTIGIAIALVVVTCSIFYACSHESRVEIRDEHGHGQEHKR